MASQYAGWAINPDGFFAMGSGPLRAKARVERELFAKLGYAEDAARGVLVLEGRTLPTDDVAAWVAGKGRRGAGRRSRSPWRRRPASPAACRSWRACIETGLHKMDTLGFDVTRVRERDRHRAAAAGREERHARDRPHQRLRPLRRPGALHRATPTTTSWPSWPSGCRRPASRRLRHAVLRHLQALRQRLLQDRPDALQPRRSVADERDERPHVSRRAARTPTCCARRSSVRDRAACTSSSSAPAPAGTPTSCAARWPSAGTSACVLPYEGLVARMGRRRAPAPRLERRAAVAILDADAVLARIIPQRLARADHLPRRRAALDRGARRAGDELAARDRALRGQVLHDRAAAGSRAADARDRRLRARGRRDGRRRARWATSIIKPIFGSMGHGMVRVSDPDVALPRRASRSSRSRAVFYVQRAVDHGGRDVRVFVVGGRVLGAIERRAPDGRLAHQRGARRVGAAVRAARRVGSSWRCARRRPSAPTTPAWICCRRATAACSCSRSTASRAGRGCSRPPGSTWPARSSSTWSACARAGAAQRQRSLPA